MTVCCSGKMKCFEVGSEGVQRGCVLERNGRSLHVEGWKAEKAREPTAESLVRYEESETESIRNRAEST